MSQADDPMMRPVQGVIIREGKKETFVLRPSLQEQVRPSSESTLLLESQKGSEKLPWSVSDGETLKILDASGNMICIISQIYLHGRRTSVDALSIAALIINSVNNYDSLVNALNIARTWMPQDPVSEEFPIAHSDMAIVNEALAKVKS